MKQFNQKLVIAAVMLLSSAAITTHVQAEGEAFAQASWLSALATQAGNIASNPLEAAKFLSTNASVKTVALSAAGCLTALGAIKLAKKVPGFLQDSLSWLKKHRVEVEGCLIGAAAGILISSPMLLCDKDQLPEAILASFSAYVLFMQFVERFIN